MINNNEVIVPLLANFTNNLPKEVLEADAPAIEVELADLDAEFVKRNMNFPPNLITILDSICKNAVPPLSQESFQELVKACFSKSPAENFKNAVQKILTPNDRNDFIVLCNGAIRFKFELKFFNEINNNDALHMIELARTIKEENFASIAAARAIEEEKFAEEKKASMKCVLGIGATKAVMIAAGIALTSLLSLLLPTPLLVAGICLGWIRGICPSVYAILTSDKITMLDLFTTGKVMPIDVRPLHKKAAVLAFVATDCLWIGAGMAFGPIGALIVAAAETALILAMTAVVWFAIAMQKFQPEQEVVRNAEVLLSASNEPELREGSIGSAHVPLLEGSNGASVRSR